LGRRNVGEEKCWEGDEGLYTEEGALLIRSECPPGLDKGFLS
jgi:hypothetical protein